MINEWTIGGVAVVFGLIAAGAGPWMVRTLFRRNRNKTAAAQSPQSPTDA
jgi:hypothetical protein